MIHFQQVSKAFGTQQVLLDVSFAVHKGERVGIVGPNGAGKSTLFEMLCGHLEPDHGTVSRPEGLVIGYVRQQLNPHQSELTLIEYSENAVPAVRDIQTEIHALEQRLAALSATERESALRRLGELQTEFEHRGGYLLKNRAETALSGLGFATTSFEQPFRALSGGWQMRAELARTLVADPDVLLLDEPTNFLDTPAVEWLRDYLRTFKGTLLLVAHDRYLLNSLTTVTLEVVGGRVSRYPGNYAWYAQEREERARHLEAAGKNQQRRREQVERFVERFRAKNTKSSQVQSRLKMLEKMEEIDVPQGLPKAPKIRLPQPPHCGVEVIRCEDAGLSYDGARWVLRHVDVRLERGEKAAMVGLNGMGKTTLLRVLAGKLPLTEGRRVLGHQVLIGYQSQDFTDVMAPDMGVFETARRVAVDRSDGEVRDLLGGFGFGGEATEKKVAVLSGGEKVRLALARLLLTPCNFLILDEPTTHLDIGAREALEEALRTYDGTLCLVSHDIEFIRHVATGIYALTPDGIRRYYGGYDYYREKLTQDQATAATGPETETPLTKAGERKVQKREEARLRQERYARRRPLELAIAAAEKELADLDQEQRQILKALETGQKDLNYATLNRRLTEIQQRNAVLLAEWEKASLEFEELTAEYEGK